MFGATLALIDDGISRARQVTPKLSVMFPSLRFQHAAASPMHCQSQQDDGEDDEDQPYEEHHMPGIADPRTYTTTTAPQPVLGQS